MTICGHTGPTTGRVTIASHGTGHSFPLTVRGLGIGVGSLGGVAGIAWRLLVASRDPRNSWSRVEPAPAVAGGSIPRPMLSLQDLARLFLSLSGSLVQRDAVMGSLFLAAGANGAGALPGPATPVMSAGPSACSSAIVPAPGVVSTTDAASVTGSAS